MAIFDVGSDGTFDERVTLRMGDFELLIAKDYEVDVDYFTQPNAFSINVGSAATARADI